MAQDGTITDTNIGVMLVSREENPTLLWRLSAVTAPLWSTAATQLRLPLDGRAGDRKQETARVDAWYIANAQLGHPVGVKMNGPELPLGVYASDIILQIDGQSISPKLIDQALVAPRPIKAAPGVAQQYIGSINEKRQRTPVTVTVNRQGRVIKLATNKIDAPGNGEPAWSGANNPYHIPSLTGITGSSAGLGLALSYVQVLSGVDLTNGQRIAATGSITLGRDGRTYVGEIAGLQAKVEGALNAGYTTLIVPSSQYSETLRYTTGHQVTVIGASTLEAAIDTLCLRAGTCKQLDRYIRKQQKS